MKINASLRGKLPRVAPPVPWQSKDGLRDGWKVTLPGRLPLATPALADGRLFLGGGFGSYDFYALDAASGHVLWQYQTEDEIAPGRARSARPSCGGGDQPVRPGRGPRSPGEPTVRSDLPAQDGRGQRAPGPAPVCPELPTPLILPRRTPGSVWSWSAHVRRPHRGPLGDHPP